MMELARQTAVDDGTALDDPSVRSRIADWYVEAEGLRLINARNITALGRGATPGPEASIAKVVSASKQQEISAFGMDLMEMGGTLVGDDAPAHGLFQAGFLGSPGIRIAGGSDEILRNIIAERVLQLPGDIRVDRGVPFSDIPSGSA
jgi:alkylation response protein AidB-like acyl-CoA dehydrogenase